MPLASDGIYDGMKATEYRLMLDGLESPGVTRISGLSEGTFGVVEQPDGGGLLVRKVSTAKVTFETLSITRRMDGSPEDQRFLDWWRETFYLSENFSRGSQVRRSFQIVKLDYGTPVLAFLVMRAWIKSSKFSDLEAGSDAFFEQTVELEHEGLERIPPA